MQREVHDMYFLQTLTPLWKLRRHHFNSGGQTLLIKEKKEKRKKL